MTEKEYEMIDSLRMKIRRVESLLRKENRVIFTDRWNNDFGSTSYREASDIWHLDKNFIDKFKEILESSNKEIISLLEAELAKLKAEYDSIVISKKRGTT